MSIRQKRTMTEKSLEAHRRNARQSRGPVTEVGKKRLRDANISHGFYAQDGGAALVALGEDPREYQDLARAVAEKWQPADAYEEQLGTQLIRAVWRARRSDRMQEGLALRLAQESERWRQDNLHARMTKLTFNAGCLRSLAESAAQPDYVTTPSDLEMLKSFQADGVLQDMGTVIMDLLIVLRPEEDSRTLLVAGNRDARRPTLAGHRATRARRARGAQPHPRRKVRRPGRWAPGLTPDPAKHPPAGSGIAGGTAHRLLAGDPQRSVAVRARRRVCLRLQPDETAAARRGLQLSPGLAHHRPLHKTEGRSAGAKEGRPEDSAAGFRCSTGPGSGSSGNRSGDLPHRPAGFPFPSARRLGTGPGTAPSARLHPTHRSERK